MPVQKLKEFLDSNDVRYVSIQHSRAFTAQEVAASAHIRGRDMAKTVIVKLDGEFAMAVLPASHHVDFDHLKEGTGATTVQLATEKEFKDLFPGCEVGAMPPFGSLYGMQTWVAEALADNDEIAFNAGTHTEVIRMSYADFERLERPRIVRFALVGA